MTDLSRVLDLLGAPAHVELVDERQDLLRFAGSRVTYQHSEQRVVLRARVIRDGRAVWGTISQLHDDAIRALHAQLEKIARSTPAGGDTHLTTANGEAPRAETFYPVTDAATAEDRTRMLKTAIEAAPPETDLGGSITHTSLEHTVANSTGLVRSERRTRAAALFVASRKGASGYGRAVHRDAAQLAVDAAISCALDGLRQLPLRSLEPGEYRAVLSPYAVIPLIAVFAQAALGAASGFSPRLGEQLASPLVTLTDDGTDPDGLPTTFDCDGLVKKHVTLIEDGILRGLVHDARTAHQMHAAPTGHTTPPGFRFGVDPIPSHILLRGGDASEPELIESCGTGLYVQRVDYVRIVNARQTLITGNSRDATLWIDDGRVVARVPQFRFTLRLTDLLTNVERIGRQRVRGDTVFMESVVAPAVLVSRLPIQTIVE